MRMLGGRLTIRVQKLGTEMDFRLANIGIGHCRLMSDDLVVHMCSKLIPCRRHWGRDYKPEVLCSILILDARADF